MAKAGKMTAVLLAILLAAAASGASADSLEVQVTLEVDGRENPVHAAGATLFTRPPDLEALRIMTARDTAARRRAPSFLLDDEENLYQYFLFQNLVRMAENSRRAGVRQNRHGFSLGRTDRNGRISATRIQPGLYYLAVYRQGVNGTGAAWLTPVTVAPGAPAVVRLDRAGVFAFYRSR